MKKAERSSRGVAWHMETSYRGLLVSCIFEMILLPRSPTSTSRSTKYGTYQVWIHAKRARTVEMHAQTLTDKVSHYEPVWVYANLTPERCDGGG